MARSGCLWRPSQSWEKSKRSRLVAAAGFAAGASCAASAKGVCLVTRAVAPATSARATRTISAKAIRSRRRRRRARVRGIPVSSMLAVTAGPPWVSETARILPHSVRRGLTAAVVDVDLRDECCKRDGAFTRGRDRPRIDKAFAQRQALEANRLEDLSAGGRAGESNCCSCGVAEEPAARSGVLRHERGVLAWTRFRPD